MSQSKKQPEPQLLTRRSYLEDSSVVFALWKPQLSSSGRGSVRHLGLGWKVWQGECLCGFLQAMSFIQGPWLRSDLLDRLGPGAGFSTGT